MFREILKNMVVAILFSAAIFSTASSAYAQSCSSYYEMKSQIQKKKGEFLWKWKGTAAALGSCMVACKDQPSSDQTACFITACGLACLMVGVDNCFSFFNEGAAISNKETEVEAYGARNSCKK